MSANTGRARRVLAAVPVVAVAAVLLLIVVAVQPGQSIHLCSDGDQRLSADGSFVELSGTYRVDSDLSYDLTDVSVRLSLVDPVNGSRMELWSSDGLDIRGGTVTTVDLDVRVFAPTLYFLLTGLVAQEGSVLHFEAVLDGRYMMGLLKAEVSALADVPLAGEGETVAFAVVEDTPEALEVRVTGLADWLVPPSTGAVMECPGARVEAAVTAEGDGILLSVRSDGDIEGSLALMESAAEEGSLACTWDGEAVELTSGQVRMLGDALDLVREWVL